MLNNNLVLYKTTLSNNIFVALIVVPTVLRQKIFGHLHAGLNGGHKGKYKTLYIMRLRLFWTGLCENVNKWLKGCVHFISYNVWRNRKQELHFSWPLKNPFYIMHADIWSPGNSLQGNKSGCHLINTMCYLTQLVISLVTTSTMAELLATLFMEEVVLSY